MGAGNAISQNVFAIWRCSVSGGSVSIGGPKARNGPLCPTGVLTFRMKSLALVTLVLQKLHEEIEIWGSNQ